MHLLYRLRPVIGCLLVALWALLTANQAIASESLRRDLKSVAERIKKTLEQEKQRGVAIGDFTGPAQADTNFGPGLSQLLTEALQQEGVTVDRRAFLSIKGRYAGVKEDKNNPNAKLIVKLTVEIIDSNDDVKDTITAQIKNNTDVAKALGVTVSLPPQADAKTKNERIEKAKDQPTGTFDGTKVKASPGSPFAVEILVKPHAGATAQARAPVLRDGQAFVDIRKDELYEIRIHNQHPTHDAAVTINIDGLDVYTFAEEKDLQTGRCRFSHFILAPRSSGNIRGWFKTLKRSDAFLVTEYGKGAISQMPQHSRGKVGVITVTFALASRSTEPVDLPDDEKGARSGGTETGFGPPIKTDLQPIRRNILSVRDIVTVRYAR
jgi:hypothetical protein